MLHLKTYGKNASHAASILLSEVLEVSVTEQPKLARCDGDDDEVAVI